jgi:signal transduction histidine kinase
VVAGRCVGVLNVNRINHTETFEDFHSEVLVIFADHVAAVIERAEIVNRLGSRTIQLEADNRKLSEMNRMKDVFLSTASHELKTPLTSIIGYAEILGDRTITIPETDRVEFVGRLHVEAHRLLALIEEVLDLSRIECGKLVLNRTRLSLSDLVRSAADTARPLAQRHGVSIVLDVAEGTPELSVDEVKMRQVIVNLLVNAAKYSPKNGIITARTGVDGCFASIEVIDQGPGIHPDDAAHIFELFGQGAHGLERRSGGIGIGLHLVKRLTELHGGHVSLRSSMDGSTFVVRLPLALATSPVDGTTAAACDGLETAGEIVAA